MELVLPSEKLIANYVVVLCHATVAIIHKIKQKGFLTRKEKLYCLQFLFFILEDFKQNVKLKSDGDSDSTDNNRITGSFTMIDNPQ